MQSEARERVVGVLGGLGPQASVDFMTKLVAATNASCDQDHLRVLLDHNPKVPNRHAAIAGTAPSVGPQLAAMARGLEAAGAEFLVMVCNTAHAYADDIRSAVSIPFISMIEVVVDALGQSSRQRVGLMAADGCLRAGLYQRALEAAGQEPILWTDTELEAFMALVYQIKAGARDPSLQVSLRGLAAALVERGADTLIAGCTEIPLILAPRDVSVPLLDSTALLVQRTIAFARNS